MTNCKKKNEEEEVEECIMACALLETVELLETVQRVAVGMDSKVRAASYWKCE